MTKNKIFFSIIIPTYNDKEGLVKCLSSVNNQLYQNFEVIICDDGSNYDVSAIANSYEFDLKVLSLSNSGGPARPRNLGIKNSKYDYLCFLDSDDQWKENYLTVVNSYILKYNYVFLSSSAYIKQGNKKKKLIIDREICNFKELLNDSNPIITSSVTLHKSLITNTNNYFDESQLLSGLEDIDLWIRLLKDNRNVKLKIIKTPIVVYNIFSESISRTKYLRYIKKHYVLYNKYKSEFKNYGLYISNLYYVCGSISLNNNDKKTAFKYLKKMFSTKIFYNLKFYKLILKMFIK